MLPRERILVLKLSYERQLNFNSKSHSANFMPCLFLSCVPMGWHLQSRDFYSADSGAGGGKGRGERGWGGRAPHGLDLCLSLLPGPQVSSRSLLTLPLLLGTRLFWPTGVLGYQVLHCCFCQYAGTGETLRGHPGPSTPADYTAGAQILLLWAPPVPGCPPWGCIKSELQHQPVISSPPWCLAASLAWGRPQSPSFSKTPIMIFFSFYPGQENLYINVGQAGGQEALVSLWYPMICLLFINGFSLF